jgi:tetratricopeptide (TPR) repeat protein
MTVIESAGGRIYQFDQSGQRLFRFGSDFTVSPRFGLFKRPTGVGVNGKGDIYVTDGDLGVIQSFKRTEFGELVHQAVRLDEEGKYEEALDKWNRILVLDGMFDRAYRGIAKAEYKAGQYREAMEHFELAFDKEGYSESFWQIRMEWLMRYFGPIVTILCAVWISLSVTLMRRRKNRRGGESGERGAAAALSWKRSWTASCKMAVHVLRHPVNGMYDAAQSPDMRVWFAALLVAAAFAVHIAGLAFTRFIFADYRFAEVSIASEAMKFFLPLLGWMLANYLVGSVMKGEGSLRAVFIVNAYALMPFLAFNLPVRVITNVLTLQEKALYDAALAGIYIWVTLLLFIGSQMVHNYNLKEVIGMNFVSLFTLCCIGLFGFALVGLLYQAADFFIQLGRELFQRA